VPVRLTVIISSHWAGVTSTASARKLCGIVDQEVEPANAVTISCMARSMLGREPRSRTSGRTRPPAHQSAVTVSLRFWVRVAEIATS